MLFQKAYIGDTAIAKMYRGETLIYPVGDLPPNYQRCNWLKSSGTQYIITPYVHKVETKLTVSNFAMYSATVRYGVFIGSASADNATDSFNFRRYSTNNSISYQRKSIQGVIAVMLERIYECVFNGKAFTIGTSSGTLTQDVTDGVYPLFLFACNLAGTAWRNSVCKLGEITATENDELKMHLIPCLDGNGTPCFYDTVTHNTLYNNGTGSFEYELE